MRIIKKSVDILFWLRIFIAPYLFFIVASILIWVYTKNVLGIVLALLVLLIGVVVSTRITEKIRRKYGAANFMSRVNATPELDNK